MYLHDVNRGGLFEAKNKEPHVGRNLAGILLAQIRYPKSRDVTIAQGIRAG